MAKLIVEEQKEFPTLPPDSIVNLLVDSVEVKTVKGNRGDWDKLEFKFKITGIQSVPGAHPSSFDALVGEFIYGSTPFKLTDSQENKLRLWAEAILNRPLELGFELDTDYFLRRECRGLTSTYEKRAINPVTNKPFIGHQVQSLMAVGGGSSVVPGQAPQQPVQQAPTGWGAPGVQQQAPQQDPWATQQQAPAPQQQAPAPANDPWAAPQQPAPQQPQYASAQQAFEEEPPF